MEAYIAPPPCYTKSCQSFSINVSTEKTAVLRLPFFRHRPDWIPQEPAQSICLRVLMHCGGALAAMPLPSWIREALSSPRETNLSAVEFSI